MSEETGKRQASHNIMRFGRTAAGHNIMRFGRAGHNIMHFGKRGGSASDDEILANAYANEAYNDPDSVDIPALSSLYVQQQQSSKQEQQQRPVTNPPSSNYFQSPEFLFSSPSNYPSSNQDETSMRRIEKKSLPSSLSEMLFAPPSPSSSTLARRVLMPHLFLSSFYSPYFNRRLSSYNYNKKADRDRDNVFMHFG